MRSIGFSRSRSRARRLACVSVVERAWVLCCVCLLSHPPTLGGITLYLVVCVLRVLRLTVACVASVSDVKTPVRLMKRKDPSYLQR